MRYAFSDNIKISKTLKYDVAVVGAGIAGLYTALNIDPRLSVAVLTKEGIETSNSWLAQGGIAAAVSKEDQPILHEADTLVAGAGMCDTAAVEVLCDEGPQDIRVLQAMNVPFDLNAEGDFSITLEGGHRMSRVVHAGGDATGRETVKALAAIAKERENIDFFEHCFFVDMLLDAQGTVCGALALDDEYFLIATANIAICTGGIGQVYESTTNPLVATGDGIAAAIRAGAALKDMEFIQFHPTGLYSPSKEDRAFLISEAVRGEGAILRNKDGFAFMEGVHELKDLAPRDIVARAIFSEMKRTGEDHVYLDATMMSADFLASRFPTIYNECLSRGLDISKDYIPVCPVQHYLMGGIETGINGMTSVTGLFASGEAARTGVHGANRLASNSMLECLVFGRRAAKYISRHSSLRPSPETVELPEVPPLAENPDTDHNALRLRLKRTMTEYVYVERSKSGLLKARDIIDDILSQAVGSYNQERSFLELLNLCLVSREIVAAALLRDKGVGAHYMIEE